MNKYFKPITYFILTTFIILSLAGCNNKARPMAGAIYLAPDSGAQLTQEELNKYPEVINVTSFNDLKKLVR